MLKTTPTNVQESQGEGYSSDFFCSTTYEMYEQTWLPNLDVHVK